MLIILGGLPGVGKSSIALCLAEKLQAVYLRIDSIEQAIKDAAKFHEDNVGIGPITEGYFVACAIAKDNLATGLTVIVDSVNPIEFTRSKYREVAEKEKVPYLEVEIICSDKYIHQKRVETRQSTIDNGLQLPSWKNVIDRVYEKWESKAMVVDTAKYSVDEAVELILSNLRP